MVTEWSVKNCKLVLRAWKDERIARSSDSLHIQKGSLGICGITAEYHYLVLYIKSLKKIIEQCVNAIIENHQLVYFERLRFRVEEYKCFIWSYNFMFLLINFFHYWQMSHSIVG